MTLKSTLLDKRDHAEELLQEKLDDRKYFGKRVKKDLEAKKVIDKLYKDNDLYIDLLQGYVDEIDRALREEEHRLNLYETTHTN